MAQITRCDYCGKDIDDYGTSAKISMRITSPCLAYNPFDDDVCGECSEKIKKYLDSFKSKKGGSR